MVLTYFVLRVFFKKTAWFERDEIIMGFGEIVNPVNFKSTL